MATYSVFAILTLLIFGYTSATKRLVLHSDDDILQALSKLQTEFSTLTTTLQTEVSTLKTEVGALTAQLQTQNNTWAAKLQTEVSTMAAKFQTQNVTLTAKFQAEIGTLNTKISTLNSALSSVTNSNIGSTYIRWGRTVCPGNGSELVYHGYMAGSKYTETGGSSKSLCLPADPTWGKYVEGYQGYAVIYGTEIDLSHQISTALFGKNVNDEDVPCAVCRSSRSAQVMIPARTRCYAGWTMEYAGYIMSAYPTQNNFVDYVCLDESLEFVAHGASNDNEHILYPVEVRCGKLGSLPCPPFVDGRELSCVVCTK